MTDASSGGATRPRVTFMITTYNRISELVKTLENCLAQSCHSQEILVVDDCSPDGTYETVLREFPTVKIVRNAKNKGSIASRNDILRRAEGDYIIALDDDSRFVATDACQRIVDRLDRESDLGILGFQIVGPEHPATLDSANWVQGEFEASSFVACGAALRRSMLQETGLFPEFFYHAYEEPDLAMRAWDAGYRVVQWNDIVVYHDFSGLNRNEQRTHRRHARNEACSVILRYPWWLVAPAVGGKLFGQLLYAAKRGWLWQEPRVWWDVLVRTPQALRDRQPIRWETLRKILKLNRSR